MIRLKFGCFLLVASTTYLLYLKHQSAGAFEAAATQDVSARVVRGFVARPRGDLAAKLEDGGVDAPSKIPSAARDELPVERGSRIEHATSPVAGGHWEYAEDVPRPYTFSSKVCGATYLSKGDCTKAETNCPTTLTNWVYVGNDKKPYPRFAVAGFRMSMKNRRIVFIGPSIVRQQVQALVWALGFEKVTWVPIRLNNCTAERKCVSEIASNITICYQFMGSMATKVYHEGSYTLDHSLRGFGDSSCLLREDMIANLNEFDVAVVQTVAWW